MTSPLPTRSEARNARCPGRCGGSVGRRDRTAHRGRHHRSPPARPGARRRADGRPDRHLRPGRRRGPAAEHLLPVPPDRRRHRRLGRARRRHGGGVRRAGTRRPRRRRHHRDRPRTSPPSARAARSTTATAARSTRPPPPGSSPTWPRRCWTGCGRPAARRRRSRQHSTPPGTRTTCARAPRSRSTCCSSGSPGCWTQSVSPEAAFGGTFHINETWSQLDAAYRSRRRRDRARPLPCEIYCHSLTDPSILSPELQASGAQTLTVFGLHVPDRLVTAENNDDAPRRTAVRRPEHP